MVAAMSLLLLRRRNRREFDEAPAQAPSLIQNGKLHLCLCPLDHMIACGFLVAPGLHQPDVRADRQIKRASKTSNLKLRACPALSPHEANSSQVQAAPIHQYANLSTPLLL